MSRYFAIQSWVSSHDNEPDYSGQQTGSRNVRSIEIPMYTQHGKANVDWFSDEAIAARTAKKAPAVSIKDKILPQFKRLNVLQSQMVELENSYRAGEIDIKTYSMLRDIVVTKIQRQEVLYRRAISVRPTPHEDGEFTDEMPEDEAVFYARNSDHHNTDTRTWVDDLSPSNSLKTPIKKALQLSRKLIESYHSFKTFIKETQQHWKEIRSR